MLALLAAGTRALRGTGKLGLAKKAPATTVALPTAAVAVGRRTTAPAASATAVADSGCTPDTDRFDAQIPPEASGVIESSDYGDAGPLGSQILGPATANPYYEIGMPTDGPHDLHPVGVMLEIHGGGWLQVGPGLVGKMRPDANFWRSQGWETINFDYRGCWQSNSDVLAVYDRVRQVVGHDAVLCASGQSSGASLALILAAETGPGGVSCVIGQAAVTNIASLGQGRAYPSGDGGTNPARLASSIVTGFHASSATQLQAFSPITYAGSFSTPVLLATAINDVVIPLTQATSFAAAVLGSHPGAYVDVDELPCPTLTSLVRLCQDTILSRLHATDGVEIVHGRTTVAGIAEFRQRERALVAFVLAARP